MSQEIEVKLPTTILSTENYNILKFVLIETCSQCSKHLYFTR